jgi:catechol 2,3-dioxygenase
MGRARWPLGELTLKVEDLDREVGFYRTCGLQELERSKAEATMGTQAGVLLRLRQPAGIEPRPANSSGLHHLALLVPDEEHLAGFLARAVLSGIPLTGALEHLVSQSLYLDDPEGNGIEVYADRPRDTWTWSEGRLMIETRPLDLAHLRTLGDPRWPGFPPPTCLGHVHLNVADLSRSRHFYEDVGMAITVETPPFCCFGWDGYHHHLGTNVLRGPDPEPVRPELAGLEGFTVYGRPEVTRDLIDPDGVLLEVAH